MKKILYILLIGVLILTFWGCFSNDEDTSAAKNSEQTKQNAASESIAELQVGDSRNGELREMVVPVQAQNVEENGYHISIFGANFDKSTGDTLEDTFTVGAGLKNESSDAAMNRGMAMGFKNSSNPETAKKDAYLSEATEKPLYWVSTKSALKSLKILAIPMLF